MYNIDGQDISLINIYISLLQLSGPIINLKLKNVSVLELGNVTIIDS